MRACVRGWVGGLRALASPALRWSPCCHCACALLTPSPPPAPAAPQVCRTTVTSATLQQAQSLHSMAKNELVAICSQGSTAFILVPYLDSQQRVKLAGFLLRF